MFSLYSYDVNSVFSLIQGSSDDSSSVDDSVSKSDSDAPSDSASELASESELSRSGCVDETSSEIGRAGFVWRTGLQ